MLPENPCLIDTDILSYILKHKAPVKKRAEIYLTQYQSLQISQITYYEVLRGLLAVNATTKLEKFKALLNVIDIIEVDKQVLDSAAKIYAYLKPNGEFIGELDILIAATALANNYILVTNNIKHYQKIQKYTDLKIENWNNP